MADCRGDTANRAGCVGSVGRVCITNFILFARRRNIVRCRLGKQRL